MGCESKWRLWHAKPLSGFGLDFIYHLGGRVGNIAVYANTGAEFRMGWSVPNDFGTCPIRPGCDVGNSMGNDMDSMAKSKFGLHFFTAVDGRFVLRDIFLDGNTFQDSHSVDKETFVADLAAGMAFYYGRLRLSYAYIYRTKEFEQQDKNHAFGAVLVSYFY